MSVTCTARYARSIPVSPQPMTSTFLSWTGAHTAQAACTASLSGHACAYRLPMGERVRTTFEGWRHSWMDAVGSTRFEGWRHSWMDAYFEDGLLLVLGGMNEPLAAEALEAGDRRRVGELVQPRADADRIVVLGEP